MPSQVIRRRKTLNRRPKNRLLLPGGMSFLQRNWKKRLAGWLRGRMLLLMIFGGLLWLTYQMASSPQFKVAEVHVSGNRLIPASDVVEAAGVKDKSILLINHRQVEQSLSRLKALRTAKAYAELPNRVVIEVAERPASFIWKVRDTLYLVSDDGIVLGTTPTVNQAVALVDVDGAPVAMGGQVDEDALQTAKWLFDVLPGEISYTPTYFEYSRSEGVVLPTAFAGRIAFGWSEDRENKLAALKSIVQTIKQQDLKVKYLDLRPKDRPYFR